jgi:thiamine-monophosphate kinase
VTARRRRPVAGDPASADTRNLALGQGAEFDLVRAFLARWGDAARGIGSDAAVLDVPSGHRLVVSTDMSVEGVHFRRPWLTAAEIGYRATVAALSDLAAAAARPVGVLLGLAAPPEWRADLPAVADGVGQAARDAAVPVVGGDTSAGPALLLTVTVLGVAVHPVTRSGARAGDRVYVSGTFGGPAAALRAWMRGATPEASARARFARPTPRLREAEWLAAHGTTAAVDVSDGLVADLGHLAAASGVGMVLDLDRLPRWPGLTAVEAATAGEEYELAVAAAGPIDAAAFAHEFGQPLTYLGDVVAGPLGVDARVAGSRVDHVPGYDHFST